MNLLGTTKRWERKTSARFWSAPVLWRFPTRSKAAEDCRPSSVAALRRVDSPRRWREDQRSLRFMVPMRAPRARKLSMNLPPRPSPMRWERVSAGRVRDFEVASNWRTENWVNRV
jgi:hypothetical protein